MLTHAKKMQRILTLHQPWTQYRCAGVAALYFVPLSCDLQILKYLYTLSIQWNECGTHSQLNGIDVWQESEKFAILGTSGNSTSWVYTENGTSTTTTSIHTSTTTVTSTSTTTLSSSSTSSSSTSSSSTSSLLQADNSTFDEQCKQLDKYSTEHVVLEVQRCQDTLDNTPNGALHELHNYVDCRADVVLAGSVCETLLRESVEAAYTEMERRDTLRTVDKKITVSASFNTLYQGSCEEIYEDFETVSASHRYYHTAAHTLTTSLTASCTFTVALSHSSSCFHHQTHGTSLASFYLRINEHGGGVADEFSRASTHRV